MERDCIILAPEMPMSSKIRNLQIDTSKIRLKRDEKDRLLEENKDIVGIGTSRTSLRFFAPRNKNFSTMLLSIFPIIVTDNLFREVVLPPPFISIEDFAVCRFEEALCSVDGVTTCQTVCKYEDETYFRIMIGVPEGDIEETYTSLFDLFGFKHIKTDGLILEED